MRIRHLAPLVVLALVGCRTINPVIAYGNEATVQIDKLTPKNERRGFAMAEQHCKKYGKVPRISADQGRRITFDCVRSE